MKNSAETQYEKDLQVEIAYNNGSKITKGGYNLLLSIRDMKLFCKIGMVPNRLWKLKNVKAYFGITGRKEKVLEELEQLKDELMASK